MNKPIPKALSEGAKAKIRRQRKQAAKRVHFVQIDSDIMKRIERQSDYFDQYCLAAIIASLDCDEYDEKMRRKMKR